VEEDEENTNQKDTPRVLNLSNVRNSYLQDIDNKTCTDRIITRKSVEETKFSVDEHSFDGNNTPQINQESIAVDGGAFRLASIESDRES
jgi:uncharacterized protein